MVLFAGLAQNAFSTRMRLRFRPANEASMSSFLRGADNVKMNGSLADCLANPKKSPIVSTMLGKRLGSARDVEIGLCRPVSTSSVFPKTAWRRIARNAPIKWKLVA
jgi:hypothetical protein